jgi:hypothetical protein
MKKEHIALKKAVHFLDLAIRLFIKNSDSAAAISLAGEAEELFNKVLTDRGELTPLNDVKSTMAKKNGLSIKEVNALHANRVKNWLKHGGVPTLVYDEEEEAFQYIMRAILSYCLVFHKLDNQHFAFIDHIRAKMPQFCDKIDMSIIDKFKLRNQEHSAAH